MNFDNGELSKWIWVGVCLGQAAEFYLPVISDPVVSKTMFAGTQTVFRTKTAGLGTRTIAEAQAVCNEWTGTGPFNTCGDWVELGTPRLTNAALGTRAGGNMTSIERTADDTVRLGWPPARAACSCRRTSTPSRGGRYGPASTTMLR